MTLVEGSTGRQPCLRVLSWPGPCWVPGHRGGPSSSALAPGQDRRGGHRSNRKTKAGRSTFFTALGLMWGGRFGGFVGNLGLPSSDLKPKVLLQGCPPAELGMRDPAWDRDCCRGCCTSPYPRVPGSPWLCEGRIWPGIHGILCRWNNLLPQGTAPLQPREPH